MCDEKKGCPGDAPLMSTEKKVKPTVVEKLVKKLESIVRIHNVTIREFFAEFLGTFVLMVFGLGSIAQAVLSRSAAGTMLSINFAWGLGVAMGIWVSGKVSGGHLNPAVTTAFVLLGKLSIVKMFVYWIAQYLAAFFGAAAIYCLYKDAINDFDGGVRYIEGPNGTAGIFANYPQPYLTTKSAFGDQVLGTMMLMMCIMALTDDNNIRLPEGLVPAGVAGSLIAIGTSFGLNCGYPVNPARDLSPRLFTAIAGWGPRVFLAYPYWWWVPVVAPHIGAICGAWLYRLMIGIHLPVVKASPTIPTNEPTAAGKQWTNLATMEDKNGVDLNGLTDSIV